MFEKLIAVACLMLIGPVGAFANLSKDDVRKILRSSRGMTAAKANAIIESLEQVHGTVDGNQLKISAFLRGSRFNVGLIKDRKIWNFDVTYVPSGKSQAMTVKNLVRAEVFNGGLKGKIAYDWMWIALPNRMTLEDLGSFSTGRGLSGSLTRLTTSIYTFFNHMNAIRNIGQTGIWPAVKSFSSIQGWAVTLLLPDFTGGVIKDTRGRLSVFSASLGLNYSVFTFPQIKFYLNRDHLHSYY